MSDHTLKSPPPEGERENLHDRIVTAELKLMTGEQLTPMEQRILAYTVFAGGCASCAQ
ncbi:hypothetical protein ABZ863_10130 [Saccharomonospora sp. NPDC046836]|uniref:hypothetical protein n=1 Tax=Saccharomonospora sp. NPDC046836 TaxID=3156921 RepID=UPI0033D28C3F